MSETRLTRSGERVPVDEKKRALYRQYQAELKSLRQAFQTSRPLCAPEERSFTYHKPTRVGSDLRVVGWKLVTETIAVQLRQFGIPMFEEQVARLVEEIRQVKALIRVLGCYPAGYESLDERGNYE